MHKDHELSLRQKCNSECYVVWLHVKSNDVGLRD